MAVPGPREPPSPLFLLLKEKGRFLLSFPACCSVGHHSYRCFLTTSSTLNLEPTNKALTSSAGNRCSYRLPVRGGRAGLATRTRRVYRGFEHLFKPSLSGGGCQRPSHQRRTATVPESRLAPGRRALRERFPAGGEARPGPPWLAAAAGPSACGELSLALPLPPCLTVLPVRGGRQARPAGRAEASEAGTGLRSPQPTDRAWREARLSCGDRNFILRKYLSVRLGGGAGNKRRGKVNESRNVKWRSFYRSGIGIAFCGLQESC